MGSLHETNPSLWVATTLGAEEFPGSESARRFDVAVVGAGIMGLTAARLLAREGVSVGVLEAGRVASGVTGYTTAKVTALQRTTLQEISARLGPERAAVYAAANAAAVETVAGLVADDGIDCAFERAPACTYTTVADDVSAIENEYGAAIASGLPARLDSNTELPLDVLAAVWLDNQAQFHPREYCLGLARAVRASGGTVLEHTRAVDVVEADGGCSVVTERGTFSADHVIVASHLPFLAAGAFFARAHPYRSYAVAARLAGDRLRGMYISSDAPTRSMRSTPDGWTIVGGENHKVGHPDDTRPCYEALEGWANQHFTVQDIGYRWSAQDYESVDGMPYVGRISADHARVWTGTAFRKWGMTNGTVAAMILTDLISGRDNAWAEAFDSTRIALGASIKSLVADNLDVGKRFVADRVRSWRPRPADELAPGEGAIVKLDGDAVAAYRDDSGALHAVDAACTHLGCRVTFNTAERSWDCPCHGSRFDVDGHVLQGPAVEDLASKQPDQ